MAKRPAGTAGAKPEFQIRDRDRGEQDLPRSWDDLVMEAEAEAARDLVAPRGRVAATATSPADTSNNDILVLLAQIGRRLQKSEAERQAFRQTLTDYRRLMDGLEGKTEQSEKIFLTLQDKLSKQESAEESLRRRQQELEDRQQAQAERIEKAAALADRIEEALMQQARLNRRIDKITQDKARFIRKLERIEETVVETQNALQSKAMVLLTDQNAVPASAFSQPALSPPGILKAALALGKPRAAATDDVFAPVKDRWPDLWSRRHGTAIAALAVTGVLFGLGVAGFSQWKSGQAVGSGPSDAAVASLAPAAAPDQAAAPRSSIDAAGLQPVPHFEQRPPVTDAAPASPAPDAVPDAARMTDSQLNAQFDKNPEALAAALNAIEPSTPDPDAAAHDASEPPPLPPQAYAMDKPAKATPAAAPLAPAKAAAAAPPRTAAPPAAPLSVPAPVPAPVVAAPKPAAPPSPPTAQQSAAESDNGFDAAAFIRSQTPAGALADRLKPDPALPKTVKDIEAQAFKGVPEAQHDLAAIYTAGKGGVTASYPKAAAWFLESASHGIANAAYNLGVLYHQGLGVPQNTQLAINWYRAAAARHHPEAEYNLGIAYIEGMGTHYDPALASHYFRSAARQGVMEASYNLGLIYENGLLGRPQPDQALYWYRTAADQGSPEGRAAMNQLAKAMKYSPADIDRVYNRVKAGEKAAGTDVPVSDVPMKAMDKLGEAKHDVPPANVPSGNVPSGPPSDEAAAGDTDPADTPHAIPVSDARPSSPAPDHAVVAQIQDQLVRLGLYPGPSDGIDNQVTEDAIRAYQRLSHLPEDGRPGQALLVNMLSSELGASVKAQASGQSARGRTATAAPPAESLRDDDRAMPGGT